MPDVAATTLSARAVIACFAWPAINSSTTTGCWPMYYNAARHWKAFPNTTSTKLKQEEWNHIVNQ
jgi:hypothetical protein